MTVHLLRPPPPELAPEPPRPLLYWWLVAHPVVFGMLMAEVALRAWARPTKGAKR